MQAERHLGSLCPLQERRFFERVGRSGEEKAPVSCLSGVKQAQVYLLGKINKDYKMNNAKIVTAINVMISNPDKIIVEPLTVNKELYFSYADKYVFNISTIDSAVSGRAYALYLYPELTLTEAVKLHTEGTEEEIDRVHSIPMYSFRIKTEEATQSFAELLQIVQRKAINIDQILDDIIATGWGNED